MEMVEHLQRIRTKCEELLAVAEKRTPGEWETDIHAKSPCVFTEEGDFLALDAHSSDATFIASCAGPAEAGWRSTIAAIDGFLKCEELFDRHYQVGTAEAALDDIIAAWPKEML
jgi:hypothetical protein